MAWNRRRLRRPRYNALPAACRCSQRCTRVSSQTATLNRIHGERSRCGRNTAPGASMMPSRCEASASVSEILDMGESRPDEHAIRRLHEQLHPDALEGALDIETRLAEPLVVIK